MTDVLVGLPGAPPGLQDFWLAGQRVEPGVRASLAAAAGRSATQP